jgi:putative transposase
MAYLLESTILKEEPKENLMDCQKKDNELERAMEALTAKGFDGMGTAIQILFNHAMLIERQRHLNAVAYERTENRQGYANGYKPKTVKTRIGSLDLNVPQVRDGNFYPSCLEKGIRSERALRVSLAEMYVQGVSTRKVASIVEEMCGFEVTSSQVSRAAAELDGEFDAWRNRPLGSYPYVFFDARYESIRHGGCVVDSAVLVAIGVTAQGKREVLGVSVSLSEAEAHWREFFKGLQSRGLHGTELVISDDHAGLKAARKAVFPGIPWQRCQFHLQQNAQAYVPRKDMKKKVAAGIRSIFNAPDKQEAARLLEKTAAAWQKEAPALSAWMEKNIPEGFAVFEFPEPHQKRLRTSNVCERLNKEIKRRTRVATLFPNEASCLRLVTAIAIEVSESWVTGKAYLTKEE